VLIILLAAAGIGAGFLAAAIPPLSAQTTALAQQLPHYLHSLQNHNSQLGKLDARFQIQQRLSHLLSTRGTELIGGVLGAGALVLSAASSLFVVVVLTVYFLVGMPRIKLFVYRLAPQSRRTRVILIGDEILTKVGGYVMGNFLTSVIAGLGTYIWLLIFSVPYPVLLASLVALLDLIPVIGSTIGGAIVSLVALTVSVPVALATLGFYVGYRLAEDYLLVPRIMGRAVQVPAVVSVVAVLVGGALMGVIGALVAIPAAAALRLLIHELAFRRLDTS
jgi:predicted PurR-regulated permease PerM